MDSRKIVRSKNQTRAVNSRKKEYLFKILVIGELATGKTSFIKRYVHQYFSTQYRATVSSPRCLFADINLLMICSYFFNHFKCWKNWPSSELTIDWVSDCHLNCLKESVECIDFGRVPH